MFLLFKMAPKPGRRVPAASPKGGTPKRAATPPHERGFFADEAGVSHLALTDATAVLDPGSNMRDDVSALQDLSPHLPAIISNHLPAFISNHLHLVATACNHLQSSAYSGAQRRRRGRTRRRRGGTRRRRGRRRMRRRRRRIKKTRRRSLQKTI